MNNQSKIEALIQAPDTEVLELVRLTRAFHHIHAMGMFGGGRYGAMEARRWNTGIVEARKRLGLSRREATMIVNQFADNNQHPLMMTRHSNGNKDT